LRPARERLASWFETRGVAALANGSRECAPDDRLRESGNERDAHPGFRLRSSCCGGLRPPMTAREIADALMADKAPQTTRKRQ
jgi:hypothetical protein